MLLNSMLACPERVRICQTRRSCPKNPTLQLSHALMAFMPTGERVRRAKGHSVEESYLGCARQAIGKDMVLKISTKLNIRDWSMRCRRAQVFRSSMHVVVMTGIDCPSRGRKVENRYLLDVDHSDAKWLRSTLLEACFGEPIFLCASSPRRRLER